MKLQKRASIITVLVLAAVLLLSVLPAAKTKASVTDDYHFTALAYMESSFECGCNRIGTGVMVSKNALITAAHNLICPEHNKQITSCDFWFGYHNKSNYYYEYHDRFSYTWYSDFSNGYNSADDIAYVKFNANVGDVTGWYGTQAYSASVMQKYSIDIQGYSFPDVDHVYYSSTIKDSDSKQFTFNLPAEELCDGTAVYMEGQNYASLIGIYTSYNGSKGYARRITNQLLEDMEKDGAIVLN